MRRWRLPVWWTSYQAQLPTTVEGITGVNIVKGLNRYLGDGGKEQNNDTPIVRKAA